jgi:asparagine synthase (glutamine-hydrolysing)
MTGFAGIFDLAAPTDAARLERMVRPMLRDQSYTYETYHDKELRISAGFISNDELSTPRLIWNERRDVGCFVAGEAFIDWKTNGTSETSSGSRKGVAAALVQLYERAGSAGLLELNGWFAGLIVDCRKREVSLFNDRYGLNRIYIHEDANRLLFSTEAKSLLAVNPALRALDPNGLAEWWSCGSPLAGRTLFKGVSLLAPASVWIVSGQGVRKHTYFDRSVWESQTPFSEVEFSQALEETFPRILQRYTNGSRPVAMSLTGGLDGRMIMAWAKPQPDELPCYTFNGSLRDCADVRIARKVAAACSQPHHTIMVGDKFLEDFPRLAEETVRLTDGAMDVTGAAELYVNQLAREIAPVRLTGNYGSEILRRHIAFRPGQLPEGLFSPDFVPLVRTAADTYAREARGNPLSFIAFKQVPWHHYNRLAVEQSQVTVRSPFLDNELVGLAFRTPANLATSLEPSLQLIANGNATLARIPTDRGIIYPTDRLGNRLRQAMETFLAKAEYAFDYGMPDWLTRTNTLLAPLRLERLFLGRQKFCHFRRWYRNQLAEYVTEVILDSRARSRSYLNGDLLEPMIRTHRNGTRNWTRAIHKILSLELLQRALIDCD